MIWKSFDRCIEWAKHLNENPILWKGSRLQFVKFGMWAALGTFISAFSIFYYLTAKGYPLEQEVAIYFFLGGVMVWFFSRLGHILSLGKKFYQNPKKYLLETGLYNQGGLVAGLGIAWLAVWKMGLPWPVALDAMAVGASIGLFFGRIGCYVYGCCWGRETGGHFGVKYHHKSASVLRLKPHLKGKFLYPTQLMTSLINLMIFCLSLSLLYLNATDGLIFVLFIIFHQGSRLWLEQYRDDMNFDEGRNFSTFYVALALFLTGFALIGIELSGIHSFTLDTPSFPRQNMFTSLLETLLNFNIWMGALTITAVMGFLLGIHGKKLGRW